MQNKENHEKKIPAGRIEHTCEDCVHYDYDEDADAYVCNADLDEDEMRRFLISRANRCPYYRYYSEYKSVQMQN